MPNLSLTEKIGESVNFEYVTVKPDSIETLYELNLLKIKPKDGVNIGRVTDVDGTIY